MTYPYNDGAMIYDYTEHKYALTTDYCRDVLGINLAERLNSHGSADVATLAASYLRRMSREVYMYIYSHNDSTILEYILAKSATARNLLKHVLEEQLLYWLGNGDIGVLSGIDIKRGVYASRHAVREAIISPVAVGILESTNIPEIGGSILYTGYIRADRVLPAYEEEAY